jgi:hypothetical protein
MQACPGADTDAAQISAGAVDIACGHVLCEESVMSNASFPFGRPAERKLVGRPIRFEGLQSMRLHRAV